MIERLKRFIFKDIPELLLIAAIAILFRSVLYEPYVVPSTSMLPTTIIGDRVIVQKYAYGISKHSFPFSPSLFKGRLFEFNKPKRGEVVVFKTDKVYIKRIVGLPGDTIQVIRGTLFINGKGAQLVPNNPFVYDNHVMPRFTELFPEGTRHQILDTIRDSLFDNTDIYKVPQDHYFCMGDNRDNSIDSRGKLGFIPYENFLGRVEWIMFSSPEIRWYNPLFLLNMSRFLKKIH
jgi:signal peptidase I